MRQYGPSRGQRSSSSKCEWSKRGGICADSHRPGIMNEGLWNLIQPLQDASFLTPFITPSLDKAINIRKLTLHFKVEPENEDILPFVAFGRVTFSLNYFIAPFKWLKRVEMVIPKRSCSTDEYCLLLRERKLSYGINLSNSKLRVPARLMMVPALCVEDDDTLNATASTELESLNRWFWEVEGDNYLGQTQGSPILEQVGYSFSYLSLDSSSNWR